METELKPEEKEEVVQEAGVTGGETVTPTLQEAPAPFITSQEVEELKQALSESKELIGKLTGTIEKMNEKHREEIEEIRSSLPKISEDPKAKVEGYFDYDSHANRLMSERAVNDKDKAFQEINFLNSIVK